MRDRTHLLTGALLVMTGMVCGGRAVGGDDSPFSLRYYECARVKVAPTIDGRLDDACWRRARPMSHFVDCLGQVGRPARFQTVAYVVHDAATLYVGVRCFEPHMDKLVATAVDTYAGLFSDDCVELFIDTNHDRQTYYHFATNVNGAQYEGAGFGEAWACDWRAAGRREPKAWTVEMAIPFRAIGGVPKPGLWGININREHQAGGQREYSGWSLVRGGFHKPAEFGHMAFGSLFPDLGRGDLPMIGRYAAMTLGAEADLLRLRRDAHALVSSAPASRAKVAALDGRVAALRKKFATHAHLDLAQWVDLHDALQRLGNQYRAVYWDLKFQALLGDY